MEQPNSTQEHTLPGSKQRFIILIVGSLLVSFILVMISLSLYNNSGAAQLDLSRPGYRSVSSQAISSDNTFKAYPSTGAVDQTSIEQFKSQFSTQVNNVSTIDAFGGDPLNPEGLQISAPIQ